MNLHIKERLLIPTFLPEKGTFMDYNLKKSIIQKVAITEQDRSTYAIVEKKDENRIEWDIQKDIAQPATVSFSDDELKYLRHACEEIAGQSMPDDVWRVAERIYDETQK